jgi:outer membrane protein assembly factor BamA
MKKTIAALFVSLLILSLSAQEPKAKTGEPKVKTGWSLGPLPTISFDTDLGLQYGGLLNLFNYKKGDIYPKYYQSLYFEVSRYTKGSGIFRFMFDSEYLIPGIRFTTDLSYLTDEAYDFYGFNGYDAVINKTWLDDKDPANYISRLFYRHQRQLFRFKNDFQGKLSGPKLLWNAGFTIQNFNIGSVDTAKLNKGKDSAKKLPSVPGLYDLYHEWGILSEAESNGGLINTVKVGITYDTRDNRPNPMKGIWTEAGIETSQKILGSEATFGKFYFTHRQYLTIIPRDLAFAYRLGYQQTIFGTVPFYYQSQVIVSILRGSTSEGLGGSKSLRGIWRNRVVGDGIFYGNAELRWKVVRFTFIKQNWYLGLNGFGDFGMVTSKIKFTEPNVNLLTVGQFTNSDFFKAKAETMHFSAGAGLRIVINENFIVAVDLGKAFNEQDGGMGFYMGLNYLF